MIEPNIALSGELPEPLSLPTSGLASFFGQDGESVPLPKVQVGTSANTLLHRPIDESLVATLLIRQGLPRGLPQFSLLFS